MGYYYDWLDARWVERPRSPPAARARVFPRRVLLAALVEEMDKGDSAVRLFAGVLARQLMTGDEILMREFGRDVARLSGDGLI